MQDIVSSGIETPERTGGFPSGRRHENKRQKRVRIFDAASALLRERGFSAVTTQEIAERAEVAAGTVFRYAASKSELLLMVYNEVLRTSIRTGVEYAEREPETVPAVVAMLSPLVAAAARDPENSAAYQRELIFGPRGETYRAEGLALIRELEDTIARRLRDTVPGLDPEPARLAAGTLFAVTHLAIARLSAGAATEAEVTHDLACQAAQIVAGTQPRHSAAPNEGDNA
ncbi:TetR/AcrR family transcriptional regulator [Naumannella halotolerans]|uniref:AcrR family transcriptional regulator n=1 Tax=Naumannella halotolerans TaxID=993414 RepID=A0A4R7J8V1_9ACTN|nr:TetR/AcrR family transcriptional regulator [Naumannella halotolerans]TDT33941.1 AcrR family transcriptional regulator [Naumannella halotolerans]